MLGFFEARLCLLSPALSAGGALSSATLVKRSKGISDRHKYCCVTGAIGRRHQNIHPQSIRLRRITASKLIRHLAPSNIRSLVRTPAVTWHVWPRARRPRRNEAQLPRPAFSSLGVVTPRLKYLAQLWTVTLPHVECVQLRHISTGVSAASGCCYWWLWDEEPS